MNMNVILNCDLDLAIKATELSPVFVVIKNLSMKMDLGLSCNTVFSKTIGEHFYHVIIYNPSMQTGEAWTHQNVPLFFTF